MWLALLSVAALAGDWLIESEHFANQAALESARGVMEKAGFEASIVPRYVDPGVWVYVVQVSGFADSASARSAAETLAGRTGLRMAIVDETTNAMLDQVSPASSGSAQDLLRAVVSAHGATATSLSAARQGPLRFEFRRTLANGLVVDHLWESAGDDRYCRLQIVAGKGRGSITRIVGGIAEMSVEGGPWERQDASEMRAVVDALGPAEVVPFIFGLHEGTPARHDLSQLQVVGAAYLGGAEVTVLRFDGDKMAPALELMVGREDHLLRRVTWQNGAVVHELSDYRAVGGVRVPFEIRTSRVDAQGDLVQVKALELGARLDDAHFRLATTGKAR